MLRFDDLVRLHGDLAKRIKRYEDVMGKFPPPVEVLNEFRYAERSTLHLVEILLKYVDQDALAKNEEDLRKLDHNFQQAEQALRCGIHDLVDGLVKDIAKYLEIVTRGLDPESIEAMGDFRNEVLDDLKACRAIIADSRADLNSRDESYDELYREWFEKLLAHKQRLATQVVPHMLKVQDEREAERTELIRIQNEQAELAREQRERQLQEAQLTAVRYQKTMKWTVAGVVCTVVLSLAAIILTLVGG